MIDSLRSAVLLLATIACVSDAYGHARSESYSTWRITDGHVTATITVAAGEVTALVVPGNTRTLSALFASHLTDTIAVLTDDARCTEDSSSELAAPPGFVRVEKGYACPAELGRISYDALFDALPGHIHYARSSHDDGRLGEALFTFTQREWIIGESANPETPKFSAFFTIGIKHILAGIDHIAFLLGMLLIAATPRRSVIAVTGFTLGHSLSLAAAVFGVVHAEGRLVEAFIGFTVALVAIEFFLQQRARSTLAALLVAAVAWSIGGLALQLGTVTNDGAVAFAGFGVFALFYLLISARTARDGRSSSYLLLTATVLFGVVHGFGFAGFLMDTGRLGSELLLPLLGFNLGVEIGQLGLIAAFFVVRSLTSGVRIPDLSPVAASMLCAVGVFWFVGRSLAQVST